MTSVNGNWKLEIEHGKLKIEGRVNCCWKTYPQMVRTLSSEQPTVLTLWLGMSRPRPPPPLPSPPLSSPLSPPPLRPPPSLFLFQTSNFVVVAVGGGGIVAVGVTMTQLMKALEKKKEHFGHKFAHDMSFTR